MDASILFPKLSALSGLLVVKVLGKPDEVSITCSGWPAYGAAKIFWNVELMTEPCLALLTSKELPLMFFLSTAVSIRASFLQ